MSKQKIRVLNLSTHDEDCGIGKYQEDFVRIFKDSSEVESDFYETSPNIIRTLKGDDLTAELAKFKSVLAEYGVLHIQHEFGFFHNDGEGLSIFVNIAKALKKKIVITIHTAPSLVYTPAVRTGSTPRNLLGYYKRLRASRKILEKRLLPFRLADKIITLNTHTSRELVELVGVNPDKIHQTVIPVELTDIQRNTLLSTVMGTKPKDIILSTVGFLSDKKGTHAAIKSLRFLPDSYKLAVLGGINPVSGRPEVYDEVCDLITKLGLNNRVYISGYISDDTELDKLVVSSDIALYPYDPAYYKLASSAAVNTAINNRVPVISYPAESFVEINNRVPGAITVTNSPNYYELSREVLKIDIDTQLRQADEYANKYSLQRISDELIKIYREL